MAILPDYAKYGPPGSIKALFGEPNSYLLRGPMKTYGPLTKPPFPIGEGKYEANQKELWLRFGWMLVFQSESIRSWSGKDNGWFSKNADGFVFQRGVVFSRFNTKIHIGMVEGVLISKAIPGGIYVGNNVWPSTDKSARHFINNFS